MQGFLNQTVEVNDVIHTQLGTGLNFRSAAVLIPCVQSLGGGHSITIHSASDLVPLGLYDDVEVELGTTANSQKVMKPNAVKAFAESFFRENRNGRLTLIRVTPKDGGFTIVNPAGEVDHDVWIDIMGLKSKCTTKGTSTVKDEAGVGGALVTASSSAEGVKDAVTFTTVSDGVKHTAINDKSGSEKYNWFLDLAMSKNIKPYNGKATLPDANIEKMLDMAESLAPAFYMFSVITSYTPVVKPIEATWTKAVDKILKWTEERNGKGKPPKVHILDVPRPLIIDSGWKAKAEAKVDSQLYKRTMWVANPSHLDDSVAAKVLSKHADTMHPGQRPFLRSPIKLSPGFTPALHSMTMYADYIKQNLGYVGLMEGGAGLNSGHTMTGYQLHHLIGEDVIKDAICSRLLNLVYRDNPLKFTPTEFGRLQTELEQVLREKQYNGVIGEDTSKIKAFTVTVPELETIPESERQKGELKNVQVSVRLPGGISKIIITFNSTIQ